MVVTTSIIVLGVIGIIAAILLFFAAKKFFVYEDPKIGEIENLLPGANCGGCGFQDAMRLLWNVPEPLP